MRTAVLGLLGFVSSTACAATAYEALRVIGKQRGENLLDQVVEVRGRLGAPQPKTWKVTVHDQEARGGVRELDVQGTKVAGERTPTGGAAGQPLNMNQLNLDSDGAHTVAEREAKKTGYAYDHVDYALRAGTGGGTPVWELRLVDDRDGNVATITVAADSGKLLTSDGLGTDRPPVVAANRTGRDRSEAPEPSGRETAKRRDREEKPPEPDVDKPGNKVTRFFERAGRHIGGAFQRFGDKIDRAVSGGAPPPRTGRPPQTASQPPKAPPRSYRDPNGTEYYRPRD